MNDMVIYYSSLSAPHKIECPCVNWRTSDFSVIVETFLDKDDLYTLRDNIVPGATGELYEILGEKYYWDMTFDGTNTVMISSQGSTSTLPNMRSEPIVVYIKNIKDNPLRSITPKLYVKLEMMISGGRIK
jgi:hypothetical protein